MRRRFRELSFLADYQDPPEPGSCEGYPLRIYNNLKINTPTPLWITSPTELEVNGVLMVPTKPFCISVPLYTLVFSMAPLGPAFAKGWSKLPNELKIQILAYNLVKDSKYGIEILPDQDREEYLGYLRMGPEIAKIAAWLFYKMNTFSIDQDYHHKSVMPIYRPPSAIFNFNGLVQKVILYVSPEGWYIISRVAEGCHGLTGLRHVKISFRQSYTRSDLVSRARDVRFKCRGEIVIRGRSHSQNYRPELSLQEQLDYVKSRISFLP